MTWLSSFHRWFLAHQYFAVDGKPEEEENGGSISHVIFQRISSNSSGNGAAYHKYLNQICYCCSHWTALSSGVDLPQHLQGVSHKNAASQNSSSGGDIVEPETRVE